MKRIATLTCLFLLAASLALAQGGTVCLFSDPQGNNCAIRDSAPGPLTVYVVHTQAAGVAAVQFSAPKPACMLGAVYLSDTPVFPLTIGDSQGGVTVGYGACRSGSIHALTINYFGAGTTSADCPYPILPGRFAEHIEVHDCDFNEIEAQGGTAYVNSNLPCMCSSSSAPRLRVNPLNLDFGEYLDTRSFTISNNGQGTLTWNVSEEVPWLTASPASGTGYGKVTVTVDRSGLPTGTHTGEITVTSNGGNETVTATMIVPVPVLVVSPTTLTFPAGVSPKILRVSNSGTGNLHWSTTSDQPWLSANPASGIISVQVTDVYVNIDHSELGEPMPYYGNLFVTSDGGNLTIPVVVDGGPALRVAPYELEFSETVKTNTFTIENRGGGTLAWSLAASQSWIEIVPPLSGTGYADVRVNVDPASVPCCEMRSGGVVVTSNGGTKTVEVRYEPAAPTSAGTLGVYADKQGTECNIPNVSSGLMTVYVVHNNTDASSASQFSAPKPACMTGATWVSDTPVYPITIGNSQTGVTVGYGPCIIGPIHVLTITYSMTGSSEACCTYPVLPDPSLASGKIEVVDCGFNLLYGTGTNSIVNSNFSCICGAGSVVPAEQTTWGHVKALYAPESSESIRK